ncbi:MAG: SDR family NAD(P)-dependent oxidoreductase [Planctomycetota bacterium]
MRIAILGATSGIGEAVARQLATRGDRLVLLGRDVEGLARTAADLGIVASLANPAEFGDAEPYPTVPLDLHRPAGFEVAIDAAWELFDGLDAVLVTAGQYHSQEALESDPERISGLATVNFSSTVQLCEVVRKRFLESGQRRLRLAVLGSVAGDRARKPVAIYGATKAGLAHYLDGLDLRYRGSGLHVTTVKPGFVRTPMTAGLSEPPFASDVEPVARDIVRAIDRGRRVVYTPGIWRGVMAIIRALPRLVLRRADF